MFDPPRAVIVAGPNGAGKTTFANQVLRRWSSDFTFVNADIIAAALSPSAPEEQAVRAGRLMLEELELLFQNRQSFALETTLSGRGYLRSIHRWQSEGYKVDLFFLMLDSVDEAITRVRHRVAQGGHFIPDDVVRRRYQSGYANFLHLYMPLVDEWALYNNSGAAPVLLNWGRKQ